MMITLKDISVTTMEKLFNATLPLLTGLKYTTKVLKMQRRNDNQVKIELEITESPQSTIDFEKLKKAFEDIIDEENFVKRYQASKNK
jgi:hypothetical protein